MTDTTLPSQEIVFYHNPRCSNSRNALALVRERGIEPRVVEYLDEPLDEAQLTALVQRIGLPVRELMRSKEAVYQALSLDAPDLTDEQLIQAIAHNPVLLNRPIVATSKGAALCRPPEKVLELL